MKILALDVGGSSIKSALVQNHALLTPAKRTPIDSKAEQEAILHAFHALVTEHPEADALALAFPGPFDYENGICLIEGVDKFANLYGVNIKEQFQLPARFVNDAEAAIVGEARYGGGKGLRKILGITLGTGLGSAFLENGRPTNYPWLYNQPYKGRNADETFSIRGLKRRTGKDPHEIDDPQVWQAFGRDLNEFLTPHAESFQPDAILVLGGIAAAFPLFAPALSPLAKPGHLGPSAPLLGAASRYEEVQH